MARKITIIIEDEPQNVPYPGVTVYPSYPVTYPWPNTYPTYPITYGNMSTSDGMYPDFITKYLPAVSKEIDNG